MILYYTKIGLRSLRKNPVLTVLMIFGIAIGVGACMTMLTVLYLMGSDPIPNKSNVLYSVQLDNWDANNTAGADGEPPFRLTYRDATALMDAAKASRQVAMYRFTMAVQPADPRMRPFTTVARAASADFFPMFEAPFQYGAGWSRDDDKERARVIVLNDILNERLFGGTNSVGKTVRVENVEFMVVGVLAEWQPRIKYYDMGAGKFSKPELIYVPYTSATDLKLNHDIAFGCPNGADSTEKNTSFLESECVWMAMWVELDTFPAVEEYKNFLADYVGEQKKLGRFPRPLNNRLDDVMTLLRRRHVVSDDIVMQSGLSLVFLGVCLLNTAGLLFARLMRKLPEIGVRRALGATRMHILLQYLVEAALIGLSGSVVGLTLTSFGLWAVRMLYEEYANVAVYNGPMIFWTIVASVAASLFVGIYPTWRASQVDPAIQVKLQ